jgi:hypothetical protein
MNNHYFLHLLIAAKGLFTRAVSCVRFVTTLVIEIATEAKFAINCVFEIV